MTKKVTDDQTGDEENERFFLLRTYTLFNADQVEGEAAEGFQVHEEAGQPHAEPDFQPAEELIQATQADIRHGVNVNKSPALRPVVS
jgi:antirestriction protein ArdC